MLIALVIAFAVSLIPSLGVYFLLKNRMHEGQQVEQQYKASCKDAFKSGLLTVFPIMALSLVFDIFERRSGIFGSSELLRDAFHCFVVFALAEELAKYLMFRRHLDKIGFAYSWLDMISFMTIIGLSFGLIEDVVYAFGTGPGQMIVRGITAGHLVYGFIMGYFMGKGRKTGKKAYSVLGFLIPWLAHGAYDFGLSDSFLALSDVSAFLPMGLALMDVVMIIVTIVFMRRARNNPKYTELLS